MRDIDTNAGMEAYVLSMLPATFGQIANTMPDGGHAGPYYRKVDGALQRLRRRGRITFSRQGNKTIWTEVRADEA